MHELDINPLATVGGFEICSQGTVVASNTARIKLKSNTYLCFIFEQKVEHMYVNRKVCNRIINKNIDNESFRLR